MPALFVVFAAWVVRQWSIARTESDMAETTSVLGPFVASEEVRQLALASGLSSVEHPDLPQVTAPDSAYDGSTTIVAWTAHEVDRGPHEPPVAPDARGVVISFQPDGTLALDQLTAFLPEERRGRTPEEVGWIAFARYGEDDRMWAVEATGETIATERIDLRVMTRSGVRIGRVTAEGAPPRNVRDTRELFQAPPTQVTREIVALLDDPEPAPTIVLRPDEETCPEEGMPTTFVEVLVVPRTCALGATTACLTACTAGDPGSCLAAADTMAHGWTRAAQRMYRLACVAGSAEGCLREEALRLAALGPAETACASRVYARLCTAGDPRACALLPSPAAGE